MKKKQIIALLISLALSLGILFICAYIALDRSFPMAGPIPLPAEETITSIICGHQSDLLLTVEPDRYGELLQMLSTAQPTRKMTVNDTPGARPFYTISIDTPLREYRYYLYIENGQEYIEIPYEGIYESNQHILDWIPVD